MDVSSLVKILLVFFNVVATIMNEGFELGPDFVSFFQCCCNHYE